MKRIFQFVLLLPYLFVSCSEEIEIDRKDRHSGKEIIINAHGNEIITRGTPINSETDPLFNSINVYAYESTAFTSAGASTVFLSDHEATQSSDNKWSFPKTYYWPNEGKLTFMSYFAYPSSGNGITIGADDSGNPLINYTVPTSVTNQPDLMVATTMKDQEKTLVNLNFNQALACIGFKVSCTPASDDTFTFNQIEYIGIKGIAVTGSLPMLCDGSINWTTGVINDDVYEIGLSTTEVPGNVTDVTANDGYLMMIPQALQSGAYAVIKFTGLEEKVVKLDNLTAEWKAGYKYIYTLNEGAYVFNATANPATCDYTGGTFDITVNSTYSSQSGTSENVGWKAVIDYPDGTSEWISDFTETTSDGGTGVKFNLTGVLNDFSTKTIDVQWLQEADAVTDVDLSYFDGSYQSANCYIVNAPGSYRFPCWIMGNGLVGSPTSSKSGATLNDKCFDTGGSFVNYLDYPILNTDSLIIDTEGATAEVIWMGADELINNVALEGDYITFSVKKETVQLGNALIAIKDSKGRIMWSWHIWITPWILPVYKYDGNVIFYGENIGVSLPAEYDYAQRTATITFTQDNTNETCQVTLTQLANTITKGINSPYYQWGRKDPMLPSMGNNTDVTTFPSNVYQTKSAPVTMGQAIQNPNVFYYTSENENWCSTLNSSFWGIANSSGTYKTIYDPSPISLCVPAATDIESLTKVGWMPSYPGYEFKQGQNTVIFMAEGDRSYNAGTLENANEFGYNWTNSVDISGYKGQAIEVNISSEQTAPFYTGYGFTVMPVFKGPIN